MAEDPRPLLRTGVRVAAALLVLLLLAAAVPVARAQSSYAIATVFYGSGSIADPSTGVRRSIALLNLTESYTEAHGGNGTYEAFSQIFVEFSIPANASGPADGPGLRIRFSYYVDARCLQLSTTECPLGTNTTAISQDVLELDVRRVLEYRDANGNGAYDLGEPTVRDIPLARPEAPFASLWAFWRNLSQATLPFNWNVSTADVDLAQGALFAGDPLLDAMGNFRIAVGTGVPLNLTLNSFLFLRPSSYKGIPLTPSQLKLDIAIGGLVYAATDTALALELALSSTQFRFQANASGSSESLYASSAAAAAFFTWSSNATVDGRPGSVGSTVLTTNDTARTVFLAYPRGDVIYHDPILGLASRPGTFASRPPTSGNPIDGTPWIVALVAVAATGGLVATMVLLERRRRNHA